MSHSSNDAIQNKLNSKTYADWCVNYYNKSNELGQFNLAFSAGLIPELARRLKLACEMLRREQDYLGNSYHMETFVQELEAMPEEPKE